MKPFRKNLQSRGTEQWELLFGRAENEKHMKIILDYDQIQGKMQTVPEQCFVAAKISLRSFYTGFWAKNPQTSDHPPDIIDMAVMKSIWG